MPQKLDKDFDRIVKRKLEKLSVEPAPEVWKNIQQALESQPARKKIPFAWLSAACILLLSAFVFWFNTPSTTQPDLIVQKLETPAAEKSNLVPVAESLIEAEVETKATAAVSKKSAKKIQANAPILLVEKPAETESLVAHTRQKTENMELAPAIAVNQESATQTTAALVNASETPESENIDEPVRPKRKLRTLGDLVNFVVAQVDSREDKIIEVTDRDQEGIRLTGLNLGLLKIKNTNK